MSDRVKVKTSFDQLVEMMTDADSHWPREKNGRTGEQFKENLGGYMQTLRITVNDEKTKQLLLRMLHTVDGVQVKETRQAAHRNTANALLQLSGIWKNRSVSIDDIREKAWERTVK